MTVSTLGNRVSYAGNGVTTVFLYPNRFLLDADIVVLSVVDATGVVTTKTLTTHYTLTGAGGPAGGNVTMLVAPPTGTTLVIYQDAALTQPIDPTNGDPLDVDATIETGLDRSTLQIQRLRSLSDRSMRLNDGDTSGADPVLPVPLANNLLGWNSAANGIENKVPAAVGLTVVTPFVATILDDADAATVRSTIGAVGLTGDETVAGVKAFTGANTHAGVETFPTVTNVYSTSTQAANAAFVQKAAAHQVGLQATQRWVVRTGTAALFWASIAWSPQLRLFAAPANNSTAVMTSPDGITWTARTGAAANGWLGTAWSPSLGLFAACADNGVLNRIQTSPDGINWTIRTTPVDNSWEAISWSPSLGMFAAVSTTGTGNRVMTSTNGTTWTIRTTPADNSWQHLVWADTLGLFVAVAQTGTENRVMTSPDGINWTIRTSAADNNWRGVEWSSDLGLLVAVSATGTGNRVMTSPNGIDWTIRTSPADLSWQAVAWSPAFGLFAAVAEDVGVTSVMTSPNGIDWTLRTSSPGIFNLDAIAWSPELRIFVSVGYGGTGSIMTSA